MEFSAFMQIFKKNIWIFLVVVIVFGVVAFAFTYQKPATYQATSAMEVARSQTQKQSQVPYYEYDNYYNVQVSAGLSDNLVGWLAAPSTVAQIYKNAGYDIPKAKLTDLSKVFTVKKKVASSSVLDVSYTSPDPDKAQNLIKAAMDDLKSKVEQYNKADDSAKFSVNVSDPVVIISPKPTAINTVIAIVIGLLVSVGIAFGKESLKK